VQKGSLKGYLFRFSLVHVIIYVFIALLFRNYLNYNEQFTSSVLYNNFRNIDSTIMRFAPLFQLGRGLLLGLIIYPIYNCIIGVKYGWLRLFALLWGLSLIGSVAATPGSIEGFIYTKTPIIEHLLGLPEVTLQTMLFSLIFVSWEKRRLNKRLQRKEIIEESTKEE